MDIPLGERREDGRSVPADLPDASLVPEAVRDAARRAPGHWIGIVDPEWTRPGTPPGWAVVGEWQSDADGSVGEYRANPQYRPSARVLGWPEPTDPVDAAAQRAATGYGTVEDALAVLAETDVTVVRGRRAGRSWPPGGTGRRSCWCSPRPHMNSCPRHFTMTPCPPGSWPDRWRTSAPC